MHGFADVFIGKAANGDFTLVPGSTTVERRTGVDHGRSGKCPERLKTGVMGTCTTVNLRCSEMF